MKRPMFAKTVFLSLVVFFYGLTLLQAKTPTFLTMDFELRDYAKVMQSDSELNAIRRLKTSLAEQLEERGFIAKVADTKDWNAHNKGVGYLFDHPSESKKLGEKYDADYAVVGKISKPTHLFVYLIVRVLDVKKGEFVVRYKVEVKGRWIDFLDKGVKTLAQNIATEFNESERKTPR